MDAAELSAGKSHTHQHGDRIYQHAHSHAHDHEHSNDESSGARVLPVEQAILEKNERLAERNRGYFKAKGLLVINLLSSPGAGKTTLIERTINDLRDRLSIGVIVGDLATDNDAQRIRATGAPVTQIITGAVCHLDAAMVAHAAESMKLDGLRLLIIENVGNLVCPAAYDLGEDLRMVLLSTTEGEDKPLKYPVIFKTAHVVVVTKMDLAVAASFEREKALANIHGVAPQARQFELSARDGQGLETWYEFLTDSVARGLS
ncbi:MAG: hydrogenase nickel incorporation protein HypB [Planctomycetota bacterium]